MPNQRRVLGRATSLKSGNENYGYTVEVAALSQGGWESVATRSGRWAGAGLMPKPFEHRVHAAKIEQLSEAVEELCLELAKLTDIGAANEISRLFSLAFNDASRAAFLAGTNTKQSDSDPYWFEVAAFRWSDAEFEFAVKCVGPHAGMDPYPQRFEWLLPGDTLDAAFEAVGEAVKALKAQSSKDLRDEAQYQQLTDACHTTERAARVALSEPSS